MKLEMPERRLAEQISRVIADEPDEWAFEIVALRQRTAALEAALRQHHGKLPADTVCPVCGDPERSLLTPPDSTETK